MPASSANASVNPPPRSPALPRHLKNAPISEALIDFRAVPPPGFPVEALKEATQDLKSEFPIVQEQRLTQTTLEIREGKPAPAQVQQSLRGYAYKSNDGATIVQFRVDGFTFSRLKPYTSWEAILPRALALWDIYEKFAEPLIIPRLAVRYINHLQIPSQSQLIELQDYLTAPPVIPAGIPQNYSSFLSRVVLEDSAPPATAIITQALEPVVGPTTVTILLDIDAFRVNEAGFDRSMFPDVFESLHSLKNRIFFNSITETTAGMYDDNRP